MDPLCFDYAVVRGFAQESNRIFTPRCIKLLRLVSAVVVFMLSTAVAAL